MPGGAVWGITLLLATQGVPLVKRTLLTAVSLWAVTAAAQPSQLDKTYARVLSSVVGVEAGASVGAGVVLHADGFVATAAHLVAQTESVMVRFHDGNRAPARLITLSRSEDTALLKVDRLPPGVTVAQLADSDRLAVGHSVLTVSPESRALTLGIVRSIRTASGSSPLGPKQLLQVDESLNQGLFGLPLFDAGGTVVGLLSNVSALSGDPRASGFAVPATALRRRLFDNPLPYVGMALRYVGPEMARLLNWPAEHALLVEWVRPGSAADNAGIRGGKVEAQIGGVPLRLGGDLLVKVGDLDVSQLEQIGQFLHSRKVGSILRYMLIRDGKPTSAEVVVEELVKVPPLARPAAAPGGKQR